MAAAFQIAAFVVFAFIAIAGALGMTTTMSMFRSGIFLMASFIGVAGLLILLSADLIGMLQVMMYIGGMLVMILFMVLFMHDPGGAMMAGMDMAPIERWFSKGLVPRHPQSDHQHQAQHHHQGHAMQDEGHGSGESEARRTAEPEDDEQDGMDMSDMSMVTPIRPLAAWLAVGIAIVLAGLLLLRPAWRIVEGMPDPNSARRVGQLLMEKYMVAFEGAGVLILIGIFGAVLLARPSSYPDDPSRGAKVAVEAKPAPVVDDRLKPLGDGG